MTVQVSHVQFVGRSRLDKSNRKQLLKQVPRNNGFGSAAKSVSAGAVVIFLGENDSQHSTNPPSIVANRRVTKSAN